MKKTSVRQRLREVLVEEHLTTDELVIAVYEVWERVGERAREEIERHLERCGVCRGIVERERARNPLVALYRQE